MGVVPARVSKSMIIETSGLDDAVCCSPDGAGWMSEVVGE